MYSVIKKSELEKVIGGEDKKGSFVDVTVKTSWGDYIGKWTGVSKEHGKPKPTE